jgi:hypothetical protein
MSTILIGGSPRAAEYINAEQTATENLEDVLNPAEAALSAAPARQDGLFITLKSSLDDSPAWLRDSELELAFRGYSFERQYRSEDPNDTFALGLKARFEILPVSVSVTTTPTPSG